MTLCLAHPQHGYYMTRDPFGARGDFTTAPEISQMFGELIGLWAAAVWRMMGSPAKLLLVELGPGRGTLMADALRAAQIMPGFRKAVDLHLVEISPALQRRQREALGGTDAPMTLAPEPARGARGPGDHPRQRVLRCPADPSMRQAGRRLARARHRHRRCRQIRVRARARSDPAFRPPAAAQAARRAGGHAVRMAHRPCRATSSAAAWRTRAAPRS